MKTRSRSLACAAFLAFALAAEASASGPYQITGTVETQVGPLVRTELTAPPVRGAAGAGVGEAGVRVEAGFAGTLTP